MRFLGTARRDNHGKGFDPLSQARTGPLGVNVDTKSCVAQEAAGIYPRQSVTEPCKTVDSPAKIGRLDGHQDLHLRHDLEHHRAFQKLRKSASTSAAS
jgi:hypothetical protein